MNLDKLKTIFTLINLKNFAVKYNFPYDHLRRVLNGERVLTEKYAEDLKTALGKFKNEIEF